MSRDITGKLPDGALGEILKELRRISERLGAVEEKVDQRQFETKSIWERSLSEITDLRSEVTDLRSEIREEFGAVKSRLDRLEGVFGAVCGLTAGSHFIRPISS